MGATALRAVFDTAYGGDAECLWGDRLLSVMRSAESVVGRARSLLVVYELLGLLGDGEPRRMLTECALRRGARAATSLARGREEVPPIASLRNLEAMVDAIVWPRPTRASGG